MDHVAHGSGHQPAIDPGLLALGPEADKSLLIVDDDRAFCQSIGARDGIARFRGDRGVDGGRGGSPLWRSPRRLSRVIDMRLTDGNGLDVMSALKARRPESRAVILTGYGNIVTAVTAVKLGAFDYLAKPADADEIFNALMATQHDKAALPENPMSADRVRWEHIQRIYELCGRNVSGNRSAPQHASPHPAAHPRQTRAALIDSTISANCRPAGPAWPPVPCRLPANRRSSSAGPRRRSARL